MSKHINNSVHSRTRRRSPTSRRRITRRRSPVRRSTRRSSPTRRNTRRSSPTSRSIRRRSPVRRSARRSIIGSPVFSYKKKSKKLNRTQSLVDTKTIKSFSDLESLVDIKTLLNLSGDKKRKLLESLVFFSQIERNFSNSIFNNLQKSKSEKDFIQKCKRIEMSDLTKLNLVLYMYQVILLLKKSKNSSKFGMFTASDENGMELTRETINNQFICPICLDNFISRGSRGSLKLKGNRQISIICARGHMCHTVCIEELIDFQEKENEDKGYDKEVTCPSCREGIEELKTLNLVHEGKFSYLQEENKESLVKSVSSIESIEYLNPPGWVVERREREHESSDTTIGTVMMWMFIFAVAWFNYNIMTTQLQK